MEKHLSNLVEKLASETAVSSVDIDRLCVLSGSRRPQVYDLIAGYIAREFASGRLCFEDADAVANFLWAESSFSLVGFAKDVFLAFDDGEHLAHGDDATTDPVKKYTHPQVLDLLARAAQV
jgi:hypothetical protein